MATELASRGKLRYLRRNGGGLDIPSSAARVRSIVLWLLTAEVVLLIATGVFLYFRYTPVTTSAPRHLLSARYRLALDVRTAHQVVAWLTVPTSIMLPVLLLASRDGARSWRAWFGRVAHALALPLVVIGAVLTGLVLPFDQVGLWAVEVGTNFDGYELLRDDRVRFVLIGGSEVSVHSILALLTIHAVGFGLALVALTAAAWRLRTPAEASNQ